MFRGGFNAAEGGASALESRASAVSGTPPSALSTLPTGADEAPRLRSIPTAASPNSDTPASGDASDIGWDRRYLRRAVLGDLFAAALAAVIAFFGRFGLDPEAAAGSMTLAFAGILPIAWVITAAANRAYEPRFAGFGTTEFERLSRAFLYLTAVIAFVSYAAKLELARGVIVVALPVTLILSCCTRLAVRTSLRRSRRRGDAMTGVLVVGEAERVLEFAAQVRRERSAGLAVVGACVPSPHAGLAADARALDDAGIELFGCADEIRHAVSVSGARRVVVLAGGLDASDLRTLAWDLEETSADLVIAPGLTGIVGRRLHIEPVAGSPLIFLDEPTFTGARKVIKGLLDRAVAAVALLLLAPALLAVAALVRLTSRGPALFLQTRVGRDGKPFRMVKFRSMHVDAEQRLAGLVSQNQHGDDGVLFKMRDDPRITRVGRTLRRYSIDELPQLLNVLAGSMSLVGPRPPLPVEVERYEQPAHRRLRVKPGLTGLWQVSGRSDLSWQESVRLDLHYVENWSLALDLAVLARTVHAVVKSRGAY